MIKTRKKNSAASFQEEHNKDTITLVSQNGEHKTTS
jgi:hypothetical protein